MSYSFAWVRKCSLIHSLPVIGLEMFRRRPDSVCHATILRDAFKVSNDINGRSYAPFACQQNYPITISSFQENYHPYHCMEGIYRAALHTASICATMTVMGAPPRYPPPPAPHQIRGHTEDRLLANGSPYLPKLIKQP